MPLRPCLDCGTLINGSRCDNCRSGKQRVRDQRRGSRQDRGYDAAHEAERRRWEPVVDSGRATCHELICLEPSRAIAAGADFHLAHDRRHPGHYLGPAHPRCNTAEAGRYAATLKNPASPTPQDPRTK